ncbi:unnamed protein product, partial [Mesorhabditis belari]|uniref:Ground-like domain-containing protein n=1 Tax=Mesorhabditis belari TaxID=2138241 RepID=A0AAF3EZ38_9BILA
MPLDFRSFISLLSFLVIAHTISVANVPICVCPEIKCPVCEDCSLSHRSSALLKDKEILNNNRIQFNPSPRWSIVEDVKRSPETIKIGISQLKSITNGNLKERAHVTTRMSVNVEKREPLIEQAPHARNLIISTPQTSTASSARNIGATRISLKPINLNTTRSFAFRRLISAKWAHTFRWPTTEVRLRTIAPKQKITLRPIIKDDYDLNEEEEILRNRVLAQIKEKNEVVKTTPTVLSTTVPVATSTTTETTTTKISVDSISTTSPPTTTPRVIVSSDSPIVEQISPSGYASSSLFGSRTHTFDPTKCNNGEWAELLEKKMMQNDATSSKQRISNELGESALRAVSVLCSRTTISFRLVATKYCQMTSGDVTCLIFEP